MTETSERSKALPTEFQALARWEDWIQWVEEERIQTRLNSTIDEIGEFYDAMLPYMEAILKYFSTIDPSGMGDDDLALFCLATSFMEIADTVEYYSPHSTAPQAMPRFNPHHGLFGMPDETRRVRFIA